MKTTMILILLGLTAITMLTLGCEGIPGDRGEAGPPGPDGPPYVGPVPANRFFALAIANNSKSVHSGAPKLWLCFDGSSQAGGDTVVSQQLAEGKIPAVDGVDGGTTEWGDKVTNVTIIRASGGYNGIASAQVRSAYDADYVYFQVRWTEVEDAELGVTVGENVNPAPWSYPPNGEGNPRIWSRSSENEDRLKLLFEITPVTRFNADGCFVTCHATEDSVRNRYFHATRGSREFVDVWHWTSGTTNFAGHALDRYFDSRSYGVKSDVGISPVIDNVEYNTVGDTIYRPRYMASFDPNSNSQPPLWDYEVALVSDAGWLPGSVLPSFINTIPSGSAADLVAVGKYDDGTWTVELRRKRRTGNGDDAQF